MSALHTQDMAAALEAARVECGLMRHPFMGAEHLLIGLAVEADGAGGQFLRARGFPPRKLRAAVRDLVGRGRKAPEGEPPPTLRALASLRLAENLAQGYGESVNTLHLLWALLQDRDSDALRILVDAGVDPSTWAGALEELLAEPTRRRPRVFSFGLGERPPAQVAEARRWRERLLAAGEHLRERIVGQDSAVERVADTLTRSWAGLIAAGRPLASFLFAGTRGAGKSTLARNLSEFLYGDDERFIRLNMDEFSDEMRALRLIGTVHGGPGDMEGVLTRLVQEYPYSVLYLEDVDRAHPRAMEAIHQILQRGHVYDGRGQRVEFRDAVVILAISVDPEYFEGTQPVGFRLSARDSASTQERLEKVLMPELERVLRTDTLNLVDEAVFFPPLGRREMTELLESWTLELTRELAQKRDVRVTLTPSLCDYLIRRGADLGSGAGVLKRLFVREVSSSLARSMLQGQFREGDAVVVTEEGEGVVVRRQAPVPPAAPPAEGKRRPRGRKGA